jgi:hypothetical protein
MHKPTAARRGQSNELHTNERKTFTKHVEPLDNARRMTNLFVVRVQYRKTVAVVLYRDSSS